MQIKCALFTIITILLVSCNRDHSENGQSSNVQLQSSDLEYAKGFKIIKESDYKKVIIHNPWQGAKDVNYEYLLVNKDQKLNENIEDFNVIRTPVERVICLSTTHIAFIDVLNETQSIVSVSGTDYVNNLKIRERIDNNEIQDVGYDNSLNYELIASLNPDLVLTFGISGQVAGYTQKLNDLGIQTMIIAEYLETHPLGKLEWIKLISALYEKNDIAQNYFDNIVSEYNELSKVTRNINDKPRVLLGLPWKGSWFVPGGNSFLAKMIHDAGGDYIWTENESRESLPFDMESIFVKASDADIWINTGTVNKKEDIIKLDERFKDFPPYYKKIYNNNSQLNKSGGNNYWEQGLVEPHIVLKDMIKVFHPNLLPEHELVYYKIIE